MEGACLTSDSDFFFLLSLNYNLRDLSSGGPISSSTNETFFPLIVPNVRIKGTEMHPLPPSILPVALFPSFSWKNK